MCVRVHTGEKNESKILVIFVVYLEHGKLSNHCYQQKPGLSAVCCEYWEPKRKIFFLMERKRKMCIKHVIIFHLIQDQDHTYLYFLLSTDIIVECLYCRYILYQKIRECMKEQTWKIDGLGNSKSFSDSLFPLAFKFAHEELTKAHTTLNYLCKKLMHVVCVPCRVVVTKVIKE